MKLINLFIIKEQYTKKQLIKSAYESGKRLFKDQFAFDGVTKIKYVNLSDLQKDSDKYDDSDSEKPSANTFSHAFFPSSNDGLDISDSPWDRASTEWVDIDGNIYYYVGEEVWVIKADVNLKSDKIWKRNLPAHDLVTRRPPDEYDDY